MISFTKDEFEMLKQALRSNNNIFEVERFISAVEHRLNLEDRVLTADENERIFVFRQSLQNSGLPADDIPDIFLLWDNSIGMDYYLDKDFYLKLFSINKPDFSKSYRIDFKCGDVNNFYSSTIFRIFFSKEEKEWEILYLRGPLFDSFFPESGNKELFKD